MNDSLVEKIKKLLRLGQSSNQHEAELALQRAFELASRHKIDLAGIDIDEETKKILHEHFRVGARFSLIRKLTLTIVQRFFNVRVIVATPNLIFVGTEMDIQIATYVHGFLTSACSRSLRQFEAAERRKLSKTKRTGFIAGFMYGVATKLDHAKERLAIDDTKTALIQLEAKKRDDYVDENFQTESYKIEKGRPNASAMMAGFHTGKNLEINPALNTAAQAPKQLTL